MDTPLTFGEVVKERRLSLGLTQAELANRVGCAKITIRKIEANDLRPSVQMAELIALALNIPDQDQLAFVRLARDLKKPTPLPTPSPLPGEIGLEDLSGRGIKGFQLGEKIGSGGFGVVYRAVQPSVGRDVAVKIILPQYANLPQFIHRFEAEAQVVARLEHPHIVPLYDYWREPDSAYLIMRLLRGGSLETMLREGALPLNTVNHLIQQIGLALAAAHRHGVVHRDIKPANVLLDDEENAYLADFGIAKNLLNVSGKSATVGGGLIGSPAYISPEQILSEPVRPQSDIYCLGIMLFEMLTGHKPFLGPTPVAYIQQHLTEPLPSIQTHNPDLPAALDAVIQQATAKNTSDRYQNVSTLLIDFEMALPAGDGVAQDGQPSTTAVTIKTEELSTLENPFKGLRPFSEADAANFYGRTVLIQELLSRLSETEDLCRFLAVMGPSGSGKSSVVKAGLVPALRRGGLPGSENWFIIDFTPGHHPWEEVEAALLRVAVNPPESLLGQLQESERGLLRASQRVLPNDGETELVMIIDQFEELFTLVEDETVRQHFLDSLVTAVMDPRCRLRVIVTVRADFIDRPLQYVDFGELIRQRSEMVLPLTPDELEQAITRPVTSLGLTMEPDLVATIIHDVGDQPGSLPLLQYALTELFDRRDGRAFTLDAYQQIGGVTGALAQRADEIYAALNAAGQAASRQLFLRLVTLGEGVEDTRRRVRQSELDALSNHHSPTNDHRSPTTDYQLPITEYGRYRLLTFDRDPLTREPTVEVAHEALLREWGLLRRWLEESRADVRLQRLLAGAAAEWEQSDRDGGFLLRGSRLDQFENWAADTTLALTATEHSYLQASLEAREQREAEEAARQAREAALEQRSRRVLRALVAVFLVAAIIAAGLAILANNQRQAAQRQAAILLASGAEAALEAGFYDRAVLLALEALQNYPYTPEAERALGRAVSYNRALGQYDGHENAVTGVDWSPDGRLVASISSANTVHIWEATTGEVVQEIQLPEGITGNLVDMGLAVQWVANGQQLAILSGDRYLLGSQDYDLSLWDIETGEQLKTVEITNAAPPEQEGTGTLSTPTNYSTGAGLDLSPTNQLLASLGGDNTALVWDEQLTKPQLTLVGHENDVNTVQWSPDGTRLATSSLDGTARIWDANSGEELLKLQAHEGRVNTAVWSPDGTLLATAGEDGQICIWDAENGQQEHCFSPDAGPIWSLAWSLDSSRLFSGHENGRIHSYSLADDLLQFTLTGHEGPIIALSRQADSNNLVSGDGINRARVWNGNRTTAFAELPTSLYGDWTEDGRYLALPIGDLFGEGPPRGLAIWDMEAEAIIKDNIVADEFGDYMWAEAWYSPDDTRIIMRGGSEAWPNVLPDGLTAWVFDVQTGEVIKSFSSTDDENWLRNVAWKPNGSQVAGAKINGEIHIWDYETGDLITTLLHDEGAFVINVNWSPDGSKIASSSTNSIVRVWDTNTWELLFSLTGHEPPTEVIVPVWSPDGSRILTVAGNDQLGSSDTTARIWDGETGEELLVIPGHTRHISWGDWSPDGSRIVTASNDNTMRIWDAETGAELLVLDTPNTFIGFAAWSPTGDYIANNNYLGDSAIWRVWQSTEELLSYAEDCCVFRGLTEAERLQFGLPLEE